MADWSLVVPGQQVDRLTELVYGRPHPSLGAHVLSYTAHDRVHPEPTSWRFTPLCAVVVGLDLVAPARSGYPRHPVCGLRDRPLTVTEPAGRSVGVAVGLTPLGAHALLGVPLGELANQAVGLADLVGQRVDLLTERLAEAPDWSARFRLLDTVLIDRLRHGPTLVRPIHAAWQRLTTANGRVRISALADEIGWTRQHLVRRCREHLGLTPKTIARLARLRLATSLLPGQPLAEVALACGYADQAHLNRDFRLLTGCTPTGTTTADPPVWTSA